MKSAVLVMADGLGHGRTCAPSIRRAERLTGVRGRPTVARACCIYVVDHCMTKVEIAADAGSAKMGAKVRS